MEKEELESATNNIDDEETPADEQDFATEIVQEPDDNHEKTSSANLKPNTTMISARKNVT